MYFVRIFVLEIPEHILVTGFSCSKYRKLHIHGIQHLFHHIGNQIKSFLICHPGNNTNHKGIITDWKSQGLLQLNLIHSLICHIIFGKMILNVWVFEWVVLLIV